MSDKEKSPEEKAAEEALKRRRAERKRIWKETGGLFGSIACAGQSHFFAPVCKPPKRMKISAATLRISCRVLATLARGQWPRRYG